MTDPHPRIVELANELLRNATTIGELASDEIRRTVDFYTTTSLVTRDALNTSVIAHFRYIFGAIVGDPLDATVATQIGTDRAIAGVPLPAILAAYRVGIRFLWERTVEQARASADIPVDSILDLGSLVFVAQETYTQAMTKAYQAQMTLEILGREEQRAAFVEALLTGRINGTQRLWESADVLRLPATGTYAVVAAEVPELGKHSLPMVESRLEAKGIRSAWRLLPDLQVGIVFLRQPADQRTTCSQICRRTGNARSTPRCARSARGTVSPTTQSSSCKLCRWRSRSSPCWLYRSVSASSPAQPGYYVRHWTPSAASLRARCFAARPTPHTSLRPASSTRRRR